MTIGVLFGGPTPEHDISILTGLQALRELNRSNNDVTGIYWTKNGSFLMTPGNAEAEMFLDGPPKGWTEVALRLGDGGGFFAAAGRLAKDRRLDLDVVVLATHGGPGEDGTLQAALDLANVMYTGPSVAGAALGMDKWSFGAVMKSSGIATLPRTLLTICWDFSSIKICTR